MAVERLRQQEYKDESNHSPVSSEINFTCGFDPKLASFMNSRNADRVEFRSIRHIRRWKMLRRRNCGDDGGGHYCHYLMSVLLFSKSSTFVAKLSPESLSATFS